MANTTAPATRSAARPAPRRGLRRAEAADYIGVSPSKFDGLVADGRMPAPRLLDGCVIWDVLEIDSAFDDLPRKGHPEATTAPASTSDVWSNPRV